MVLICIGTDMAPAISLAYEKGELDIMERMPRNPQKDHLVSKKLLAFSYMAVGWLESVCCMFTYFYVLNDYGIPFNTVLFLNSNVGYHPNSGDIYNPIDPNYGNTNYGKPEFYGVIDFGYEKDAKQDIRLFFSFLR
jgi:sodium/potassium-transporting ATPase subunit alpha